MNHQISFRNLEDSLDTSKLLSTSWNAKAQTPTGRRSIALRTQLHSGVACILLMVKMSLTTRLWVHEPLWQDPVVRCASCLGGLLGGPVGSYPLCVVLSPLWRDSVVPCASCLAPCVRCPSCLVSSGWLLVSGLGVYKEKCNI